MLCKVDMNGPDQRSRDQIDSSESIDFSHRNCGCGGETWLNLKAGTKTVPVVRLLISYITIIIFSYITKKMQELMS